MKPFFAWSLGRQRSACMVAGGQRVSNSSAASASTRLVSSTHSLAGRFGVTHSSSSGCGSFTQRRFHSSGDASPEQVQRAFRTLGFSAAEAYSASQGDVKRRFLELAKSHHPDVKKPSGPTTAAASGGNAGHTMAEINAAYNLLKGFLKANPNGAASAGLGSGGYRPYGGPPGGGSHTGRPEGASPYGMGDDEAFWRGFDFAGGPPGSGGDYSARPPGFDRGVGGHPFFDQEEREAMMFAAMQEELSRMTADLPAGARVSVEEAPDGTYTVHVEAEEAPPYGRRAPFHGRRSDGEYEYEDEDEDGDEYDGFYPGDEGPAAFYAAMGGFRGGARGRGGMGGGPPFTAYGPDMMRGGRGNQFRNRGGRNHFRHNNSHGSFRGRGRGGSYQNHRNQNQSHQEGKSARPDDYARAPLGDVERDVLRNMHNAGKSFQQIATALGKDLNVVLAGFNSMHATNKNHFARRHGKQDRSKGDSSETGGGRSDNNAGDSRSGVNKSDGGSRAAEHQQHRSSNRNGGGGGNVRNGNGQRPRHSGGFNKGPRRSDQSHNHNNRGRRRADASDDDFDVDAAMADTSEPRPFTGRPIHVRPRA